MRPGREGDRAMKGVAASAVVGGESWDRWSGWVQDVAPASSCSPCEVLVRGSRRDLLWMDKIAGLIYGFRNFLIYVECLI